MKQIYKDKLNYQLICNWNSGGGADLKFLIDTREIIVFDGNTVFFLKDCAKPLKTSTDRDSGLLC